MTDLLDYIPADETIVEIERDDLGTAISVRTTYEDSDIEIVTRAADIDTLGENTLVTRRFTFNQEEGEPAILDQTDVYGTDSDIGEVAVISSQIKVINLPGIKTGAKIGEKLASPLANALFDDAGLLGKAVAGPLLKALLSDVGEVIGGGLDHLFRKGVDSNGTVLEELAENAFEDINGEALIGVGVALTSVASKIIVAEIFDTEGALDPDDELAQGLTNALIEGLILHGADLIFEEVLVHLPLSAGDIKALTDFKATSIFTDPFSVAFSIALNAALPDPETMEAQLASAAATAITSALVSALGATNPFTAALAPLTGWLVGELFDELFETENFAFGKIVFDERTGEFAVSDLAQEGTGNAQKALAVSQALADSMKEIAELTGANTHNFKNLPEWQPGTYEGEIKNAGKDGPSFASGKDAFFDAYLNNVENLEIIDGNASFVRAIEATNVEQVRASQQFKWLQDALMEFENNKGNAGTLEIDVSKEIEGIGGFKYHFDEETTVQDVFEDLIYLRYRDIDLEEYDFDYEVFDGYPGRYPAADVKESREYWEEARARLVPDEGTPEYQELVELFDKIFERSPFDDSPFRAKFIDLSNHPAYDETSTYAGTRVFLELLGVDKIYTDGELVQQLAANLQTAQDYEAYQEDHETIDAIMELMPDSNFAAGWLLTLLNADALGLDDQYNLQGQTSAKPSNSLNQNYDDHFVTGFGDDIVRGQLGDDTIILRDGNDRGFGGLGSDVLDGGAGDDVLVGGQESRAVGSGTPLNDVTLGEIEWISDAFNTSGWDSFNVRQMYFGNFEGDAKAEFVGLKRGNDAKTVETHIRDDDGSFVALEPDRFVDWRIQNHNPREVGDVNGDGLDDLVGFSDKHVHVGVSNGDGTFAEPFIAHSGVFGRNLDFDTQSKNPRKIADVDGDGRADIIGFGSSGVKVALGQDDGSFSADVIDAHPDFADRRGGWRDQFDTPRLIGDVNGDDRADIVAFKGTQVHVALGREDGTFGARSIVSANLGLSEFDHLNPDDIDRNSDHFPRRLGDLNGDGFDDIVVFNHDPLRYGRESFVGNGFLERPVFDESEQPEILVAFSLGDGTFADLSSIEVPGLPENKRSDDFDWLRFDVVDIDGDGRDDIAGFTSGKGVWAIYSQGDGDDVLIGGAGNDTLIGGDGQDTARFSGRYEDYILDEDDEGRLTVFDTREDSPDGRDVLESVEKLEFEGGYLSFDSDGTENFTDENGTPRPPSLDTSYFEDMDLRPGEWESLSAALIASKLEASGAKVFDVRVLDDRFLLRTAEGETAELNGLTIDALEHVEVSGPTQEGDIAKIWVRASDDLAQGVWQSVQVLTSGPEYNRRINGTSEDDVLSGGNGIDKIYGFDGDDTLEGGYFDDRLDGGHGDDVLDGGAGSDVLRGGNGDDTAIGGYGEDRIHGQDGNDELLGGDGGDRIFGQDGNDVIEAGAGDDKAYGGDDGDSIDGGDGDDWLYGESGKDHLVGGDGNDVLKGGQGRDKLHGGRGDDRIDGGEGNDALSGAAGNDLLWGGAGEDIFEFRRGFGRDTVEDYEVGLDKVNFRGARLEIDDLELRQVGSNTEIDWGTVDTLVLLDTVATDLTSDNFIF